MADSPTTEWLARTPEVQVRVTTLEPGQGTPWHFHGELHDVVFALDDGIEVALRAPDQHVRLGPGQRHDIAPRCVHRVVNVAAVPARYLLVQTGRYDFNVVE